MIHITAIEEIPTRGVALLDLENHHCRFPLKDAPGFCGAVRLEHSSYCAHCHVIAYPGAASRRSSAAGRFLDMTCQEVAPARPAKAREAAPALRHDEPVALGQFVRAAAAARRQSGPPPAPAVSMPKAPVLAAPYAAPQSTLADHEARKYFYLANLARQCEDIVNSTGSQTIRGARYAILLRDFVAAEINISIDEILSNRRTTEIVRPRQLAMFCVAKGALKLSLPEIGRRVFGGFDHTTVLHARDKIAAMIAAGTLPARLSRALDRVCAFDAEVAAAVRKARAS